MSTYICIPNGTETETYATDTEAECDAAMEAMRAAGLTECDVWAGDPEGPDSYKNGQRLFAEPTKITYSVYHAGALFGLGRYSGPGLTREEAEVDKIACIRQYGADAFASEDVEPSPAQATYQAAYLDELARQGGVSPVPRVMRHRQKSARRAAREAVIAAHGQDAINAAGQPR